MPPFTFPETVSYLFSKLPYFTRDGKAAYKANLDNINHLLDLLGRPERGFKSIHVAGTNGKGSVCNMLSAIFQSNGFKTGLHTSPHLKDFRERIRINGRMIPEKTVCDFVNRHFEAIEDLSPSFFELTVALTFETFKNEQVDFAIIETGLGGRLDSTNVLTPLVSVITNISDDHKDLLGDSLEQIAFEKAGIIKKNIPVVIGESQLETDHVFINKAKNEESPLYFADKNSFHGNHDIASDLIGNYQKKNIKTVLQTVEVLKELGVELNEDKTHYALQHVKDFTGFTGRFEILQNNPILIADTAHNIEGIKLVIKQIEEMQPQHLHVVFGMMRDKDHSKILEILPKQAYYYYCNPELPRAMPANDLAILANRYGLQGKAYPSVKDALESAKRNSKPDDMIYVGGSTFVVAEIIP